MNKRKVEELLPKAIEALDNGGFGIKKSDNIGDYIEKGFRSQISAFGAAVTMGSFRAAVAFFGNNGESDVERSALIRVMYYMTTGEKADSKAIVRKILALSDEEENQMKEDFINASIALKLAMNAFRLKDKSEKGEGA